MEHEGENDHVIAYLTAYYHRVKKMPDLKNLLKASKPKLKVNQSDKAMYSMVKQMHAAVGGTTI